MAFPEPIAAIELHACYLDTIRAALIGGTDEQRDLLAQLNRGELVCCWSDPWLAFRASGVDGCGRLSALFAALQRQAEAYHADGMHISARDCHWLVAKLEAGALVLATRGRVDEAREAQSAQRRSRDLDRWQRQAEARAGFS